MEAKPPADSGAAFLHRLLANAVRPDPRRTVADWAAAERVVSEGSRPGRWRNETAPYLVAPMNALSLHNRCRFVDILGPAQSGKTQVGLNLLGQVLHETPADVLVLLPSLETLRAYNRTKLERMIKATPALTQSTLDVADRSSEGSTISVKKSVRGAEIELATASSSKSLQMRTVRVVLMEEVSEYERDVGGRGDPVDQAEARTNNWRKRGFKIGAISTPGNKGSCRISERWERGSRARWHVTCPHCDTRQVLRFGNLKWPAGKPEDAAYACEGCGVLIGEGERSALHATGEYVHEQPELIGHHESYRFSILDVEFMPWSAVAEKWEKVERGEFSAKVFAQQWLAEAWDEAHDLPKAEILLLRRDKWQPGRIPPPVITLAGATDVQGNRLVWALWGFDRVFGQWLIDTGVIEGDPTLPDVWEEHDRLLARTWRDAWGKDRVPDDWGIDSGYLSTHVYRYCRGRGLDSVPRVRALDGVAKWKQPALGQPREQRITWQGKQLGKVMVWPVGTWDIKSELSGALRLTEQGPGPEGWPRGAIRFNEQVDRGWIDELLAEQCVENPRTGERTWKKIAARNEAWDCAVYARALMRHRTVQWTPQKWDEESALRLGPPAEAQADMMELWTSEARDRVAAAIERGPVPQQRPRRAPMVSSWMG